MKGSLALSILYFWLFVLIVMILDGMPPRPLHGACSPVGAVEWVRGDAYLCAAGKPVWKAVK